MGTALVKVMSQGDDKCVNRVERALAHLGGQRKCEVSKGRREDAGRTGEVGRE